MPGFDGSGQFFWTYNWVNDANNGIPITASRMDTQFSDAAGGFDLCMTRDAQGVATALIPFPFGLSSADAVTITSNSVGALVVGLAGATNPAFRVDASTASSATGIRLKSAAAAAGVALLVTSSGTDENLKIDAKGAGTTTINGVSGGITVVGGPLTVGTSALVGSDGNDIRFVGSSKNGLGVDDSSGTGGVNFTVFRSNGTAIGTIASNGGATGVAYNTSSDERLKNVLPSQRDFGWIIDNVWIGDVEFKSALGSPVLACLAQQAKAIYPQAITTPANPEEMMSADYGQFAPLALWGVKELRQRVFDLETRLMALEAR